MDDNDTITFVGTFAKATTTVDGTWRITFELDEKSAEAVIDLNKHKGYALQVAVIPFTKSGAV